ncbi:GWxTD domain-containing protein [Fodinibius salsisoli]|uniref:GWxTD domain-containing protein n=1 Tax=Fodinibius salsisoli TaxID=2820877 RepID=A0ABT3PJ36_9BACT|nr:GWxTD domain-containing protein [Fodinibius salsisoli]MCW9705948.1 GWxTD domain-containing protein [Fodinibius salsisoli]
MKNLSQHVLLLLFIFAISCSTSRNLDIERGTGYNFRAGHPEFRTSVYGYIDEEKGSTLDIRAEIVKGSLIYKEENDTLQARISIEYQVQDLENSGNILVSEQLERTVKSTEQSINATRETLDLQFSHQIDPSHYKILISVTDLNTNKNITQSVETAIPETQEGQYNLSNIQMYGKINDIGSWEPINTYDVQSKIDSLRFVFQVISPQSDQRMQIRSRLLQFESDTLYPRPMHYSNYSPSSIEYKGIDYDEETELQSSQRILTDYTSTFIEYKFANQDRGNYRFQVNAQRGEEEELFKARDFGIKSRNYPAISSAKELARPLIYLMGEGDHEELMEISNSDSLKKAVDKFWLKNIGNTNQARQVIEKYYQRVEEANKQFSNFKEGWKTDLGMIYILFGPPWYTEDHLKELIWYYSYNHSDPEYSYYFDQPKLKNKYFPFFHFLFNRSNFYYTVQYQQRQLWLSGQILTRQI